MGRPYKINSARKIHLKKIGFKSAIETGIEIDDFDGMKLELMKRGFFKIKCAEIKMTDFVRDWKNIKQALKHDDSLKWIFYYFESNGTRIPDEKGGRKMKIFENITENDGQFSKNCPTEFLAFLKVSFDHAYKYKLFKKFNSFFCLNSIDNSKNY